MSLPSLLSPSAFTNPPLKAQYPAAFESLLGIATPNSCDDLISSAKELILQMNLIDATWVYLVNLHISMWR
jgi:hypothetical protein